MTTAQGVGKVVSLMHRPPLPPGNTPGIHFCYLPPSCADCQEILGALTSWNLVGLFRALMGQLLLISVRG